MTTLKSQLTAEDERRAKELEEIWRMEYLPKSEPKQTVGSAIAMGTILAIAALECWGLAYAVVKAWGALGR